MKTPSQLRQWASGSNAKNVGEVTRRRHFQEIKAFVAEFNHLISMTTKNLEIEYAEKAEKICAEILQNGTDNKELFEIAFSSIDHAIWLIGRLNSEEKKKAADKMHGGLLAPILNKFRKLLA